jgi:hypothetical protein
VPSRDDIDVIDDVRPNRDDEDDLGSFPGVIGDSAAAPAAATTSAPDPA